MTVASLAEIKAKFSAYLVEAEASGPVVITRKGRAVAVIVAPADDADLEAILLSRSPRFRSLLGKSRRSIAGGHGQTHEKFWKGRTRSVPRRRPVGSVKRRTTA